MIVHGIDTNAPQDWKKWRAGGNLFGGIKATEGDSFVAPAFSGNADGLVAAGMGRIIYHYARPGYSTPSVEARHFADVVTSHDAHKREVLALDLEAGGVHPDMRPVDVSFWGWTFCTELQRIMPQAQVKVYASPSFIEQGNCARLGQWPLWIAHWGVPAPQVSSPWHTWRLWQYAGNNDSPDLDVFNGTLREAEQFFWSLRP